MLNNIGLKIEELIKLIISLDEEKKKLPTNSFLYKQIWYEIKKLEYILNYLKLLQKKWLILVQSVKNDIISSTD
jgi:hypothetical protein